MVPGWSLYPHYGPGANSASNTNEYQESSCGVKDGRAAGTENFTAICEPIFWETWESQHVTTVRASTVPYRDSFTLICCIC
jgi:hypothetical protein